MSLMDHVAIVTHNSLAGATVNKLNPQKPPEFFALIAFPPAAVGELQAIAQQAAGAAPLANFQIGIQTNGQKGNDKLPGIPDDWFVVRAATQYAPYICDATGTQLEQANPEHASIIKSTFYAGKKVRAALSAYAWNFKGKNGISFNLAGVMDAGEQSERMNIGVGVVANAFAGYANPNAAPAAVPGQNAQMVATPNTGNPFGGAAPAQTGAPAQSANPFAQSAPAGGNPFAQTAGA